MEPFRTNTVPPLHRIRHVRSLLGDDQDGTRTKRVKRQRCLDSSKCEARSDLTNRPSKENPVPAKEKTARLSNSRSKALPHVNPTTTLPSPQPIPLVVESYECQSQRSWETNDLLQNRYRLWYNSVVLPILEAKTVVIKVEVPVLWQALRFHGKSFRTSNDDEEANELRRMQHVLYPDRGAWEILEDERLANLPFWSSVSVSPVLASIWIRAKIVETMTTNIWGVPTPRAICLQCLGPVSRCSTPSPKYWFLPRNLNEKSAAERQTASETYGVHAAQRNQEKQTCPVRIWILQCPLAQDSDIDDNVDCYDVIAPHPCRDPSCDRCPNFQHALDERVAKRRRRIQERSRIDGQLYSEDTRVPGVDDDDHFWMVSWMDQKCPQVEGAEKELGAVHHDLMYRWQLSYCDRGYALDHTNWSSIDLDRPVWLTMENDDEQVSSTHKDSSMRPWQRITSARQVVSADPTTAPLRTTGSKIHSFFEDATNGHSVPFEVDWEASHNLSRCEISLNLLVAFLPRVLVMVILHNFASAELIQLVTLSLPFPPEARSSTQGTDTRHAIDTRQVCMPSCMLPDAIVH